MVRPSTAEIKRLVTLYREAVQDLSTAFAEAVGVGNASRLASLIAQTREMLTDLQEATSLWADRNLVRLFKDAQAEMQEAIRAQGRAVRSSQATTSFSLVNRDAIHVLLADPTSGFLTLAGKAVGQIQDRVRTIQTQAKVLRTQQRAFDQVIARVGVLEGGTVQQVKQALITEALKNKKNMDLVWNTGTTFPGAGNVAINVLDLPFVKIPDQRAKVGYRKLRIDKYMDTLARTKMNQSTEMGRRIAMLRNAIDVVQFSLNWALDDDACNLYLGKIFALTAESAKRMGIASIEQIPSGGPPLHPNCTHGTIPYFPEDASDEELAIVSEPPPKWALGRPWKEVQKEYEKRGGKSKIDEWNKAFRKFAHVTGGYARRNPGKTKVKK